MGFSPALACPIYAVDGVVLINQSAALAGNVTPGGTPGFPVTVSVSGSYTLSGNTQRPGCQYHRDSDQCGQCLHRLERVLDYRPGSLFGQPGHFLIARSGPDPGF